MDLQDGILKSFRWPVCPRRDLGPTSTHIVFRIEKSLFKVVCDKSSTRSSDVQSIIVGLAVGRHPFKGKLTAEPSMWRESDSS